MNSRLSREYHEVRESGRGRTSPSGVSEGLRGVPVFELVTLRVTQGIQVRTREGVQLSSDNAGNALRISQQLPRQQFLLRELEFGDPNKTYWDWTISVPRGIFRPEQGSWGRASNLNLLVRE